MWHTRKRSSQRSGRELWAYIEEELGRGLLECIIQPSHSQRGLADHHLSTDFSRWPKEPWNAVISGEEQAGPTKWAQGAALPHIYDHHEVGRAWSVMWSPVVTWGQFWSPFQGVHHQFCCFWDPRRKQKWMAHEKRLATDTAIARPADGTLLQCLRIARLTSSFGRAGTTLAHSFSLGPHLTLAVFLFLLFLIF